MIEIANSVGWIISFDGRIIENFSTGDNVRMHINNVKKIEIKEERGGYLGIMVTGRWGGGFNLPKIDPSHRSAIEDLVTQVNAAIKATGLGD